MGRPKRASSWRIGRPVRRASRSPRSHLGSLLYVSRDCSEHGVYATTVSANGSSSSGILIRSRRIGPAASLRRASRQCTLRPTATTCTTATSLASRCSVRRTARRRRRSSRRVRTSRTRLPLTGVAGFDRSNQSSCADASDESGSIAARALSGGAPVVVAAGQACPVMVAKDPAYVYWIRHDVDQRAGTDAIMRAAKLR